MKKSFKLLFASLAITLGIGAAAVAGVSAHSFAKEAEPVRAVTMSRINIFVKDDCWIKDTSGNGIYLTYSSSTHAMNTALRINADSDLGNVQSGLVWKQFGDTYYGIVSEVVDISAIAAGAYDNLGVMTGVSGSWFSGIWGSYPSIVNSVNTIVVSGDNGFDVGWGNYWKVTTHSGTLNYNNSHNTGSFLQPQNSAYAAEYHPGDATDAPSGYYFDGWYTETSFTNEWTSSSYPTGDVNLYAKYSAITAEFDDGDDLSYNSKTSQFESIKYFDAGAKFHIVKKTSSSTNYAALDSYMSSSVATSDGTDVTVVNAGTYAVYFKNNENTIWIELANATQEAYMYAGFFLTNVGCDANGVNLPNGWSTVATRYGTLSDDAKDIFYETTGDEGGDTIEQTVARYDYAVAHHSSLTKFMVNRSGTPRAALYVPTGVSVFTQETSTTTIVVVISALLLSGAAVGGYFLLRRKKEKNI